MLELQPVYDLGFQVHNALKPAAYGVLAACTAIAYAVSYLQTGMPGRSAASNPFLVLLQAFALSILLSLTGKINTGVQTQFHSLAEVVGGRSAIEHFLTQYTKALDKNVADDKSAFEYASEKVSGFVSGVLTLVASLVALMLLHLFDFVRALLFSILVAVSPLAIALAILPGSGVLGRWLTALIEIASWEVIASITTKMAAAASVGALGRGLALDWVTLVMSALLLCVSVALTPTIASRLVGQGFGAIGPALMATAQRQGSMLMGAASAATGLGNRGARMGAMDFHVPQSSAAAAGGASPHSPAFQHYGNSNQANANPQNSNPIFKDPREPGSGPPAANARKGER